MQCSVQNVGEEDSDQGESILIFGDPTDTVDVGDGNNGAPLTSITGMRPALLFKST
jgi:hypothetical protein